MHFLQLFFISNNKNLTLGVWQGTRDWRVYASKQNIVSILLSWVSWWIDLIYLYDRVKRFFFTWTNIKALLGIVKLNK